MAQVVLTQPNGAYFWTGGAFRQAAAIADQFGGTTLEQAIERSGITMPQFGTPRTQDSYDAWTFISRALAQQARGRAQIVVGNPPRQNNVGEVDELPTLRANPNVSCIMQVNANTQAETVIYTRSDTSARQCLEDRSLDWAQLTCPLWEHQPWPAGHPIAQIEWPDSAPAPAANEVLLGGETLPGDASSRVYSVSPAVATGSDVDLANHLNTTPALVAHFSSTAPGAVPDAFYYAPNVSTNDIDRSRSFTPQEIGCQGTAPQFPVENFPISQPLGSTTAEQVRNMFNFTVYNEFGLNSSASLADFLAAQHNITTSAGLPDLGAPSTLSGITETVNDSAITFIIPAGTLPHATSAAKNASAKTAAAAGSDADKTWESLTALSTTARTAISCLGYLDTKLAGAVDTDATKRQVCVATATLMGSLAGSVYAASKTGASMPANVWSKLVNAAGGTLLKNLGVSTALDPLVEDTWEWLSSQIGTLNSYLTALNSRVNLTWTSSEQQTLQTAVRPTSGWLPVWNSFAGQAGRTTITSSGQITNSSLGSTVQCMTGYGAHPNPQSKDPVAIAACDPNSLYQKWYVWSTTNHQLTLDGLCLDITNSSYRAYAKLELYTCTGQWNQTWRQGVFRDSDGSRKILVDNPRSGNIIDDPDFNTTPGTQLQMNWFFFGPTTATRWVLPDTAAPAEQTWGVLGDGPTTYGSANKCLDAYGTSNGAGVGQKVAVNDCNNGPAQDWAIWSDGTVRVWNKCLELQGSASGSPAVLDNCDDTPSEAASSTNSADSQSWTQQADGSLKNRATGLCLTAPYGSTTNGQQLNGNGCDGGLADQQWHLPGWTGGSGGGGTAPTGPICAIYKQYGTPCGIAVSMGRVLVDGYTGPLYQVQRLSDSALKDIGSVSGGYADAAAQDSFCASASCVVNKIYDQTANHNDLTLEVKGPRSIGTADHRADAKALPVMLNGHKVYGLKVSGSVGYRNNNTKGIATGSSPEGMYMVTSGTYNNADCCFDFGNAETDTADDKAGTMDALNFGTKCYFADSGCSKPGPWAEADLEDGLFNGGDGLNTRNTGNSSNFVTAMLKNDGGGSSAKDKYALLAGNAQTGTLDPKYEGPLPTRITSGSYKTMNLQGAVVLGTGGDNSNGSIGAFFEGVMTQGYPTSAADNAVQTNIVAAKYTGDSKGLPIDPGTLGEGAAATATQAVVHQGYTSVFTADPANGHLQENFLTHMGQAWQHQDLSDKFGIPAVMPGTQPVTLMHDGYLSVFTVAAGNGHVIQSWINLIGQDWQHTDLFTEGTPPTDQTPTAVFHDGYASVYLVDAHRDLHETYLRFIGDTWHDLDLSANGCARLLPGTGPVAVFHGGYTSIFYAGPDKHLQECYYSGIGAPLAHHDLFAIGGAPLTVQTPGALVHDGYTSVFTAADPTQHLWETYIAAIGAPWVSHDLSGADRTVTAEPTPNVAPGTSPTTLYHGGYASVFTVNETTQDIQETFLTSIGDPWHSQDFTAKFGTGKTTVSPVPLLHPSESGDNTFASVFYVDQLSNHLRESYTPAIGVPWTDHDLTSQYGLRPVLTDATGTNQYSAIHEGYTSVFTVNSSNGHLQETFLTAMGRPWQTQDLFNQGVPVATPYGKPAVIYHDGILSVFTVNNKDNTLQESVLLKVGQQWTSKNLGVKVWLPTTPAAVYHAGYTSVYTVNPDGQLQETYLSAPGASWITINLPGPKIGFGDSPAAIVHSGWVSVFTIDVNQHLEEDYLSAVGDAWVNHDLSGQYGVPTAIKQSSPAAVVHQGWTSVYTVDPNNHLQESYLPAIGDAWITQDLTDKYGAPVVACCIAPAPVYHTGWTSIYTVRNSDNHLMETALPAIGARWTSQDMTADQGAPASGPAGPSAVVHFDDIGGQNATSVFAIDVKTGHLWESYLHAIGEKWVSKDFNTAYQVPPAIA